ncbi:uncharacterized protein PRCAT00003095001 [Priceomyces carsonii]|uniref:uncharacterized protein n=1 Tax=Priceomyces carsonii TaxID=28549 RepID=UPI002ED95059|nr:unnamed protein product [Priceomyces carsonii]
MTYSPEEENLRELLPQDHPSEEQAQFNRLSRNKKLERLNTLIERSKVYSKIISENILEGAFKNANNNSKGSSNGSCSTPSRNSKKVKSPTRSKADITQLLSKGLSDNAKSKKQKIEESQTAHTQNQPRMVTGGVMKDYQLDGLQWLTTLYENGLNGILADEMGLGKTLQCISFFCFLIENGIKGPFLVVAPLSTIGNWFQEIKRFAPSISVLKYTGSKPERHKIKLNQKENVVLTSYELAIKDFNRLNSIEWRYLVVDEGHRLKNMNCVLIRFLKKLNINNRLLITGTPLQNNLDELWSLLNFILPDIFQDLELFQQWFNFDELTNFENDNNGQGEEDDEMNRAIEIKIQENLVHNLHTILKPFILRRMKKDVMIDLPPKKEYLIHIPLSHLQRKIYNDILDGKTYRSLVEAFVREYINFNYRDVFNFPEDISLVEDFLAAQYKTKELGDRNLDIDTEIIDNAVENVIPKKKTLLEERLNLKGLSIARKKQKILEFYFEEGCHEIRNLSLRNPVMQLRNICNSPYIFYEPFPIVDTPEVTEKFMKALLHNSTKFRLLDQLCKKLLPQNHKILIFSQFTRVLDLLQDWFTYEGVDVCRLDGSTGQEEREEQMKQFSLNKKKQVFLLSTRAGGLGVNLIAADTVIIFDNDWNPQVDLQAINRVHRIGQTKPVKIFRFIVKCSIEEILISKSASKRVLEKLVIQLGEFKYSQLQGIFNKKEPHLREILDFTKNLKKFQQDDSREASINYDYSDLKTVHDNNILSNAEIQELLDRSQKCYERGFVDDTLTDISVFDSSGSNDSI